MFIEIRIIYLLLRSFLFVSMAIIGYYISKKKKWKWQYIILPTIIFSLIEGLRFLRGVDYSIYYYRYETINQLNVFSFEEDPLFVLLCQTLTNLGIPFQGFVILCSCILIISSFFLLKEQKKTMQFSLPLLTTFGLISAENLIRWYLGFSFLLIGIYYLIKNKSGLYIFYSVIACGFHIGLLLVIPIFAFIFKIRQKIILNPIYLCIIYLIIYLTFKVEFMLVFVDIFSTIGDFGRYASYVNNIEGWLTGENKQLDTTISIGYIFKHLFLIIYGYKILYKQNDTYRFFYILFAIGAITYPAMHIIELAGRYNELFMFFEPFILAATLYDIFIIRKRINIYTLCALICLYPIFALILKYPFVEDIKNLLFIWNDNFSRIIRPL